MPEFKRQRTIGRVYQNPAMGTCPNMTILENMALADTKGKPFNLKRGTDKQCIDFYRENLRMLGLGLEDKLEVKVGVLSGGQRQACLLYTSSFSSAPPWNIMPIICSRSNHLSKRRCV